MGSIYQVSNQVTLGQSEREIIENLKKVVSTIVQREQELEKNAYARAKYDVEDKVWRSYGILKTARKISAKEAMQMLSNLMEAKNMGVEPMPDVNIRPVELMINIQPAIIQTTNGKDMTPTERDKARADYIRKILK